MAAHKRAGLGLALVLALPLLAFPLSWLPRSFAHFRYDWSLPLPELILASGLIVAGAWFLKRAVADDNAIGSPVFIPASWVALLLVAVLASAIASMRFSQHSYFGLERLPRLCGNMAIFLLAVSASRDWAGTARKWWMVVALIVAANGLLRLRSEPEFISTLGNKNFLGVYLAASVVMGASIGGTWALSANLILLTAMLLCHSRGAWLALGSVAILWFLGCGERFVQRWQARIIIVILFLATAGLLAQSYIQQEWRDDVRPVIWKATLRMIATRPVLGHGLGTYVAVYPKYRLPEYFLRHKSTNVTDHAHNELLETAAEQGLIGLCATLWLWVAAVRSGIRASWQTAGPERRIRLGLLGAMLVFMLHGLVDVDLQYLPNQSLLWVLMGLVVGMDTAPADIHQIRFDTRLLQWCAAGTGFVLGTWFALACVIRPIMADAWDRQARLAEESGDLRAAAEHASQALDLQPFRLSTRYLLAGVLSRLPGAHARDLAVEQCVQIEELAPDYADVTYNLGELYLTAGHPSEALPYLLRAIEINPYDADRQVALASALHDVGRDSEAMSALDRAVQLQPNRQDIRELRDKIRMAHTP